MEKIEKAIEIAQFVHQYYQQRLSVADEQKLSEWLASEPANRMQFEKMLRALETREGKSGNKYEHRVEMALDQVKSVIDRTPKPIYKRYLPYAAAIILIFLGVAVFQMNYARVEVATAQAERKELYLSDGTFVSLDPSSKLTYSKAFGKTNREVTLEGGAYFNVAKEERNPFRVSSKTIQVEVLGTSFRLKTYTGDEQASVLVTSGKVRVAARQRSSAKTVLGYGEKAVYEKGERLTTRKYNKKELGKIDAGMLVYDGERLQEVIKDLERSYGVLINCQEELKNRLFFGDFDTKERLTVFLDKLTMTVHGKWKQTSENQYIIQQH